MPTLYVVATPIGNLQDLSPRALETLRNVSFIAAEDTRVTMKLCQVFDIHTPLVSCHMHNEVDRGEELADRMLQEQADAAVVTDAGTPCISDPGHLFVRACVERGIQVLPVPGPVAGAAALSVSGMDCREWKFYGFLPREKKDLREALLRIPRETRIGIVHESPYRVLFLMEQLAEVLPDCRVSVSCDLTKMHELTLRGNVQTVFQTMKDNPKTEKGEYCLVLDVGDCRIPEEKTKVELSVEIRLLQCIMDGKTLREAQEYLSENGVRKNAVKAAALTVKKRMLEDEIW